MSFIFSLSFTTRPGELRQKQVQTPRESKAMPNSTLQLEVALEGRDSQCWCGFRHRVDRLTKFGVCVVFGCTKWLCLQHTDTTFYDTPMRGTRSQPRLMMHARRVDMKGRPCGIMTLQLRKGCICFALVSRCVTLPHRHAHANG